MAIFGIGTDICGMARIEEAFGRFGERFKARVAGGDADAAADWPPAKLARRWALKEAVAKALGTGIGAGCAFDDIIASHADNGALKVVLKNHPELTVHASVSDDAGLAVAFVILEKNP